MVTLWQKLSPDGEMSDEQYARVSAHAEMRDILERLGEGESAANSEPIKCRCIWWEGPPGVRTLDSESCEIHQPFKSPDPATKLRWSSAPSGHGGRWVSSIPESEEIEVNPLGGQGSKTECLYTGMDPRAMDALAHVLYLGAQKYARDNWRRVSTDEHLNHARRHLNLAEMVGGPEYTTTAAALKEHLSHAFCRVMMALAVYLQGGPWGPGNNPNEIRDGGN